MWVDLKACADLIPAASALNNRFAQETSYLTDAAFVALVEGATLALAAPGGEAFLIAFDQDGDYDSPNFLWFRERFARFLYIDRVVVAAAAQGQGWGRRLYAELIETAKALGHDRIVAEINIQPPNPGSLAFHERLGFAAVGERALSLDKVVRYVALEV
ncbi:MAG: GNAT family N-acetyltransferase [Asticcacaulis sp.]|uniref:GNAT family N-acetyltransferase n=1 Tax=Asticcacaulis sp. TaxID=1872648 RepID=UPI003F7B9281